MEIEWDSKKALLNLKKQGIDFADAVEDLFDEHAITISKDHPDEERFISLGRYAFNRIIVLVYRKQESRIRIISARKATAKEIKQYEV
jgi:uncharacterized DUF497 family protein